MSLQNVLQYKYIKSNDLGIKSRSTEFNINIHVTCLLRLISTEIRINAKTVITFKQNHTDQNHNGGNGKYGPTVQSSDTVSGHCN